MCIGHGVAGQPPHVHTSCHFDIMSPVKSRTCRLPRPSAARSPCCAKTRWPTCVAGPIFIAHKSIVFRDDRGSAVFVGLRAELRTCASFSRTVRTALRRLCIDVPLRGRWCTLITPREALTICASDCASRAAALPPAGDAVDAGARQRIASAHADDSDVRVVALSG